ncbi:DUF808 domain-containing protein [Comamonas sp. NLF-1-9]|uniref:DUF808 domain-containing protein n=1 Tax=Comamonas sp. NLF-1-9 TaxID=2853163 RepID=UPI001C47A69C|nr:DUF808 domain-containing protein [Comamonas sp. NLF-1-9]QXL83835.1 DUF808 domain-containing protein [Comamonas sp. NLF-1-9]
MAGASLFALLDDIATLLDDIGAMAQLAARKSAVMADDVAVLTKAAAQKTTGVLGDDLALSAEQVNGVRAERELPVVWAVAKGSLLNKAILVPAALLISAWLPWLITPLLMAGGSFLCFEGMEKLAEKWLHPAPPHAGEGKAQPAQAETPADPAAFERRRIRGAVRTDFILSSEIIIIALGTVASAPLSEQLAVLVAIALLMTVGVYGAVGAIVKTDDLGLWLRRKPWRAAQALGAALLALAPRLLRLLTWLGMLAMFLVGGSLVVHGIAPLSQGIEQASGSLAALPLGGLWRLLATGALDMLVGALVGALVLALVSAARRLRQRSS